MIDLKRKLTPWKFPEDKKPEIIDKPEPIAYTPPAPKLGRTYAPKPIDFNPNIIEYSLTKKKTPEIFKVPIQGNNDIERAAYVFRKVYGFDKPPVNLKFQIFRSLAKQGNWAAMLVGKAGTAKSLIANCVREHFNNVLYINTRSTSAGIIQALRDNPNTRILIVEEFDRMNNQDISDLRGLISDNKIYKRLKNDTINLHFDELKVLITSNGTKKFDAPMMSRFAEFYIPEYTDQEFCEVCAFCLPEFRQEVTHGIAQILIDNNMKDVRDVLLLSQSIYPDDSDEIIELAVNTYLHYNSTQTKDKDWNERE